MTIYNPFVNEDKASDSWPPGGDGTSDFTILKPYLDILNAYIATASLTKGVLIAHITSSTGRPATGSSRQGPARIRRFPPERQRPRRDDDAPAEPGVRDSDAVIRPLELSDTLGAETVGARTAGIRCSRTGRARSRGARRRRASPGHPDLLVVVEVELHQVDPHADLEQQGPGRCTALTPKNGYIVLPDFTPTGTCAFDRVGVPVPGLVPSTV